MNHKKERFTAVGGILIMIVLFLNCAIDVID